MNNAEKKLFLSKLKTETDEQLLKTLDFFRNNGDNDVLPDVLNLLKSERSQTITDCVLSLVSDLKNQSASDIVFDYMCQTNNKDTKKQLITALWQSQADFSHRSDDFVKLIINTDDFETSFEILTLFTNNANEIEANTAQEMLAAITEAQSRNHNLTNELYGIYAAHLQSIS